MPLQKVRNHIRSESKRYTPVALRPSNNIFVRIRPHEVAEKPSVGNVGGSRDAFDIVEVRQVWGQTSVHADDLFVDNGTHRKTVKGVRKRFPKFDVVSPFAYIEY